jgi:hypothetical protein
LARAAQDQSSPISRASAVKIAADADFVKALWQTVVSKPIQFRMLVKFVNTRKALISLGVDESNLPLTHELEERIRSEAGGAPS